MPGPRKGRDAMFALQNQPVTLEELEARHPIRIEPEPNVIDLKPEVVEERVNRVLDRVPPGGSNGERSNFASAVDQMKRRQGANGRARQWGISLFGGNVVSWRREPGLPTDTVVVEDEDGTAYYARFGPDGHLGAVSD